MKNSRNPFIRFINKIDGLIIYVLLALLTVVVDGTIIYGVSNSSLVNNERIINDIKKEAGNYLHIGYGLKSESEAARLSLLDPINEYNAYRIKEPGRNVTYVSNNYYEVTYEEITFSNSYIVYEDYYSDSYTINKFRIAQGSFKELEKEDVVFVSNAFLKKTKIAAKEAPGKKIKLSLNPNIEFTIGGVIHEGNAGDSGIHFNRLFNSSYILFNRQALYKYGFTDLMFAATDEYLVNDVLDFIDAYNKSYLKHENASMRVSSQKDEVMQLRYASFKPSNDEKANTYAFLSVLSLVVSGLLFLVIILFYDFNKVKLYKRIPICLILFGYQFLSVFFLVNQMKKGLFMPRLSVILFVGFLIISLIAYIYAFSFFYYEERLKKKKEKHHGKGE